MPIVPTQLMKTVKSLEFAQRMRALGVEPLVISSAEMASFIPNRTGTHNKLVTDG